MTDHKQFRKNSRRFYRFLIVICCLALVGSGILFYLKEEGPSKDEYLDVSEEDPNRIENGIHVRTGLVDAPGLQETVTNCTTCHSAKLVIQNRMNHERWRATIRWMQETQNLWDLGENEAIIVNYLAVNYPPIEKGRRAGLTNIEWYDLK